MFNKQLFSKIGILVFVFSSLLCTKAPKLAAHPFHWQDYDTTAYQTYYITIADTGKNYSLLDKEMYTLHQSLHIKIDTANRYYNEKKGIVLRENDEDEIYRGEYYPRRYASVNLSLEYLSAYADNTTAKTIALVTGLYENHKKADAALPVLKRKAPHAYILKARVYTGCMH